MHKIRFAPAGESANANAVPRAEAGHVLLIDPVDGGGEEEDE